MVLSNPTAHLLWALLAVNIIKGLAIFLIAFAITRLAKRISPEHKHLIWFTVIISFVVLPVLWFLLPAFQNRMQVTPGISEAWRLTTAPFISRDLYMENILKVYQFYVFPRETKTAIVANALIILGGVWFAGVLFYLSRYIAAQTILKKVRSSAVKVAAFNPLLAVLSKKVKLKKRVIVMSSSQCGIPFTYGFRKPYIILPESSADWTAERLNSILLHELAHIRRNDFLYKTITSIVCSLFWFLPIVWLAHSYMLREEEKSCDQFVIDEGYSGAEYASDVVDVVHASRGRLLLPSAYSGIGKKGRLKARIKNIVSMKPNQISGVIQTGRPGTDCQLLLPAPAIGNDLYNQTVCSCI